MVGRLVCCCLKVELVKIFSLAERMSDDFPVNWKTKWKRTTQAKPVRFSVALDRLRIALPVSMTINGFIRQHRKSVSITCPMPDSIAIVCQFDTIAIFSCMKFDLIGRYFCPFVARHLQFKYDQGYATKCLHLYLDTHTHTRPNPHFQRK